MNELFFMKRKHSTKNNVSQMKLSDIDSLNFKDNTSYARYIHSFLFGIYNLQPCHAYLLDAYVSNLFGPNRFGTKCYL